MRKWMTIRVGFAAVVVLVMAGCSAEQKPQQTPAAKTGDSSTSAASVPTGKANAEYPIDWCVVSGEKLGEMGPAVAYMYQGRTIKFCCKACIRDFEREPARYLARLDSAAAGMIHAPSQEEHGQGT